MKKLPILKSTHQLLFEIPLYAPYMIEAEKEVAGSEVLHELYSYTASSIKVDGHCPQCGRQTTFTVHPVSVNLATFSTLRERQAYDRISVICARNTNHQIRYWIYINNLKIEKIGQYPSLADIANDGVSDYRKLMEPEDGREFHKAIALAAHGIGVGSFVYLRRVFERIIYRRFEDFKSAEGWQNEQFYPVRMEDKIALLKDHLPEFLVDNRKVYSILSIGIHELDESACLTYFEAIKQAIIIIPEDDKKKLEEIKRRDTFAKAIANFKPPETEEANG